jgi:imidazolonepropionase-like amidohydrolase
VPGFSLHENLELMVRDAGFSPAQALRAATIEPAKYLGMQASAGSVAVGKLADLVLLERNPLADIRNTQAIAAVVQNGRYLDRPALDALLVQAEAAANRQAPSE